MTYNFKYVTIRDLNKVPDNLLYNNTEYNSENVILIDADRLGNFALKRQYARWLIEHDIDEAVRAIAHPKLNNILFDMEEKPLVIYKEYRRKFGLDALKEQFDGEEDIHTIFVPGDLEAGKQSQIYRQLREYGATGVVVHTYDLFDKYDIGFIVSNYKPMTRDNTDPLVWLGRASRNDANFVNDILMIALENTSYDPDGRIAPWKYGIEQISKRTGLSNERIVQIAEKLIAYHGLTAYYGERIP